MKVLNGKLKLVPVVELKEEMYVFIPIVYSFKLKNTFKVKAYIHVPDCENQCNYDIKRTYIVNYSDAFELNEKIKKAICEEENCTFEDILELNFRMIKEL